MSHQPGVRARWAIAAVSLGIIALAVLTVVVLHDLDEPTGTPAVPGTTTRPGRSSGRGIRV